MQSNEEIAHLPALAICGYSGSGKTTVIEKVIEQYAPQGFRIAVLKNDVHGLAIDKPGKDSDRFFEAGADIYFRGPRQRVSRMHRTESPGIADVVKSLSPHYDFILLEGHKSTPFFDKVWFYKDDQESYPDTATNILLAMGRNEDRLTAVMDILENHLTDKLSRTPVYLGVIHSEVDLLTDIQVDEVARRIADVSTTMPCYVISPDVPDEIKHICPNLPLPHGETGDLVAVETATRWAPLVNWLFVRVQDLLSTSGNVQELIPSVPQLRADPVNIQFPMYVDFRRKHFIDKEQGELDD